MVFLGGDTPPGNHRLFSAAWSAAPGRPYGIAVVVFVADGTIAGTVAVSASGAFRSAEFGSAAPEEVVEAVSTSVVLIVSAPVMDSVVITVTVGMITVVAVSVAVAVSGTRVGVMVAVSVSVAVAVLVAVLVAVSVSVAVGDAV